jgi:hypothetical protein
MLLLLLLLLFAGLPPGALDMVHKFLSRPSSCKQSEADIEQIVAAAADVMQA